jgi:hypothetical protein
VDFTRVRFGSVSPDGTLALYLPYYQTNSLAFDIRIFGRRYSFESAFEPLGADDAMIIESAREAVAKALETGADTDIDMAYNFAAIVKDEEVRAELRNLLVPFAETEETEEGAEISEDGEEKSGGNILVYVIISLAGIAVIITAAVFIFKNLKISKNKNKSKTNGEN